MHIIEPGSLNDSEQQLISTVLSSYGFTSNWKAQRGKGGMNNSTFMVEINEECYVLRQYETHNDQMKIAFEHEVLSALSRSEFELDVPVPVSLPDDKHATFLAVQDRSSGRSKIVTLFHYREGHNPVWNTPEQLSGLGRAAGMLSSVMARLPISLAPVYPPYYQIQEAYPLCAPEKLLQLCTSPPNTLMACTDDLQKLKEVLPDLFHTLRGMEDLPHQLVHGDLNASNVLADSQDIICAILDFEFATWDLRVMELAVPMSDLLTMDKEQAWVWEALESLIQGFRQQVSLEPEELGVIPTLILLRSLDVVMHFISRLFEGTDEPEVAVQQIRKLRERVDWMKSNEERLRELLI